MRVPIRGVHRSAAKLIPRISEDKREFKRFAEGGARYQQVANSNTFGEMRDKEIDVRPWNILSFCA